MKPRNKILLMTLLVLLLFSIVGCNSGGSDARYNNILSYQIKSNKTKYAYGEEITIDFLFNSPETEVSPIKDGYTYCVKIKESTYYEIIGDSVVYTDGSENSEPIEGEYLETYCYRAVFKIKVTETAMGIGAHAPNIVVNRVGDEGWHDQIFNNHEPEYSGDPEFPWGNIDPRDFGFTAVEDGVEFTDYYTTYGKPTFLQRLFKPMVKIINFLIEIFQNIFS